MRRPSKRRRDTDASQHRPFPHGSDGRLWSSAEHGWLRPYSQPGTASSPATPLPARTSAKAPVLREGEMGDRATSPWRRVAQSSGLFQALQRAPPRPSCQAPPRGPVQTTQQRTVPCDTSACQGSSSSSPRPPGSRVEGAGGWPRWGGAWIIQRHLRQPRLQPVDFMTCLCKFALVCTLYLAV